MKIDGAILSRSPADAGPAARRLEELGFDGGFTFEGPHDPFLPIAVAAGATERLELATAIAVAFARNPMTLANLGYDLQLQSHGRFILGLGSQIRPHIERRYSQTWSRPRARMREMVTAIRAIWACWHEGEKLDFRGDFYTHTLMTPFFNPGPNPYGLPRIFLAGVGAAMTETVGEVADGYFVHPLHTERYLAETLMPALGRGLERAGRTRDDIEISAQVLVATGADDEAREEARVAAKTQIAFYGSTPAYRYVLECHGRGDLHTELNRLSKSGDWSQMAALIDDDLLEEIAVVGTAAEVAARLRARYDGIVDRISPIAPFTPQPDHFAELLDHLK